MLLAVAHFFGLYNPKQLADFIGVSHQKLYSELKGWSLYYLKEILLRFMVQQAAEQLKPVFDKSDATKSRAGITLSIDNSVIDRVGTLLRCTWSRLSKNATFGPNLSPGFWTPHISLMMPILTGFGAHQRGPKSGQGE